MQTLISHENGFPEIKKIELPLSYLIVAPPLPFSQVSAGEVTVVDLSLDVWIEDDCVEDDGGVVENISSVGSLDINTICHLWWSFANCGEDNNNGLQSRLSWIGTYTWKIMIAACYQSCPSQTQRLGHYLCEQTIRFNLSLNIYAKSVWLCMLSRTSSHKTVVSLHYPLYCGSHFPEKRLASYTD